MYFICKFKSRNETRGALREREGDAGLLTEAGGHDPYAIDRLAALRKIRVRAGNYNNDTGARRQRRPPLA